MIGRGGIPLAAAVLALVGLLGVGDAAAHGGGVFDLNECIEQPRGRREYAVHLDAYQRPRGPFCDWLPATGAATLVFDLRGVGAEPIGFRIVDRAEGGGGAEIFSAPAEPRAAGVFTQALTFERPGVYQAYVVFASLDSEVVFPIWVGRRPPLLRQVRNFAIGAVAYPYVALFLLFCLLAGGSMAYSGREQRARGERMRRAVLLFATAALVAGVRSAGARHEGGSVMLETCVQTRGVHEAYWVHFDGFQNGRKFCHELPEAGPSDLVFDLKGKLVETPLSLRVAAAAGAEPPLVSLRATSYPGGVIHVGVRFPHAGHYVVSLAAERDGLRFDFPLAVGVSSGLVTRLGAWGVALMTKPNVLILYFLALFGALGLWRFAR